MRKSWFNRLWLHLAIFEIGDAIDSGHKLFQIHQIKNTQRLFKNLSYDFSKYAQVFKREVEVSSYFFVYILNVPCLSLLTWNGCAMHLRYVAFFMHFKRSIYSNKLTSRLFQYVNLSQDPKILMSCIQFLKFLPILHFRIGPSLSLCK